MAEILFSRSHPERDDQWYRYSLTFLISIYTLPIVAIIKSNFDLINPSASPDWKQKNGVPVSTKYVSQNDHGDQKAWLHNSNLHWLLVERHFKFKVLLFTFKALGGAGPLYIRDLLTTHKVHEQLQSTSSSKNILVDPKTCLKMAGDRTFIYQAAIFEIL